MLDDLRGGILDAVVAWDLDLPATDPRSSNTPEHWRRRQGSLHALRRRLGEGHPTPAKRGSHPRRSRGRVVLDTATFDLYVQV